MNNNTHTTKGEHMKQLSTCTDLDKTIKCSLWYDEVLAVYVIAGKPGEPFIYVKDKREAWEQYKATMLHGTNGMGIAQDRQSGIPISLKQ